MHLSVFAKIRYQLDLVCRGGWSSATCNAVWQDNKHRRVKINQIQLRESAEDSTKTQKKVFEDRIFSVDAAIVRIMKTRKRFVHHIQLLGLRCFVLSLFR
jgi:hypothetical protein